MKRGLPRPTTANGTPVPYVSSGPLALGKVNPQRRLEVVVGMLCQVCGEPLSNPAFAVMTTDNRRPDGHVWDSTWPVDFGLLHEQCLRLTLRHCPFIGPVRSLRLLRVDPAAFPHTKENRIEIPLVDQAALTVSFDDYR